MSTKQRAKSLIGGARERILGAPNANEAGAANADLALSTEPEKEAAVPMTALSPTPALASTPTPFPRVRAYRAGVPVASYTQARLAVVDALSREEP